MVDDDTPTDRATQLNIWLESPLDGDLSKAIAAINLGWDINVPDEDGDWPLLFACSAGHEDICLRMIEKGALTTPLNGSGETLLHEAAYKNMRKLVDKILSIGALDINVLSSMDWTPLMNAAHGGHHDLCRHLLELNADPNYVNTTKQTVLTRAINSRDEPLCQMLVDHGALLDKLYGMKEAPLETALRNGENNMVKILLRGGANPKDIGPLDLPYRQMKQAAYQEFEPGKPISKTQLLENGKPTKHALDAAVSDVFFDLIAKPLIESGQTEILAELFKALPKPLREKYPALKSELAKAASERSTVDLGQGGMHHG